MDSSEGSTEDFVSPLRKSTRKKTQPVLYGHGVTISSLTSPQSSSSNDTQKMDITQTFEENKNDESSDDDIPLSHYSPLKGKKGNAKQSKKLPVAKKGRTNKNKNNAAHEESFPDKGSMFDIIRGGRVVLQTVIDDWIENYNKDRISAMVDLIQVVIQCCGCKGVVTEDMLEEDENVNAIRKLTEVFDEDSHEYPLIMSGGGYKRFKNNFCDFISLLIEQCQHNIVYDDYMLDKLITWLISLSDSQVRAFRHTSTLAGMVLVASLIQVALKLNVELDNTQRQLDSEKRKSAQKRGQQKMEMLQNKKEQLTETIQQLEEYMNYVFQGIFVHRYRDIRPEIRCLCMTEIGNWMKNYSNYFLSHKYLKYVVWTLHDKEGEVRNHALETLYKLYQVEEFLSQLEPLTSRFKNRIVSMTLDVAPPVQVVAIKLVTLLLRYGELEEEDCEQVEQLVFCSERLVAQEAGAFLNARLLLEVEANSPTKKKASKKSELQRKVDYIRKLTDFFINNQIHDHGAYIVDSLWQHSDLLKDWELMNSILLDDKFSESLSDDEETALIELMACCCRQAATGKGPSGRFVKRLLSSKEKKAIEIDKREMSGHFMVQLPLLLEKYGTDLPKAENLVMIAQYFDLEEYSERRLGEHFDNLLDQIDDLVQKAPEKALLEECAKTYLMLMDNELTLKSQAEVARNKLIDNIVELFKEACKNPNAHDASSDKGERGNDADYTLQVNLRRLTAFYRNHDLGAWDLYDCLVEILRNMSSHDEEVIINVIVSLQMYLLWSLHSMTEKNPSKRQLNILKQRLYSFMDICCYIVENEVGEVRKEAFLSATDLMVVFAKQLVNSHPSLAPVVYTPSDEAQDIYTRFAATYAFSDVNPENEEEKEEDDENTENEVQELSSKRVVLAAICKLLAYGMFDMQQSAPIFSQLISAYGDFGDLIKQTMSKCKELSINHYTRTLALTLFQEYELLVNEAGDVFDNTSIESTALKELARRFVVTYGIDLTKDYVRKAMINFHREAILLGFHGDGNQHDESFPKSGFFDIINECASRLIPVDKKAVLKILDTELQNKQLKVEEIADDPELKSLYLYYTVMLNGSQETNEKGKKKGTMTQKARRKLSLDDAKQKVAAKKRLETSKKPSKENEAGEEIVREEAALLHENQTDNSVSKRKRDDEEDDNLPDEEENSDDDFQHSRSAKGLSQASWTASQPKNKRSESYSRVTYDSRRKDQSSVAPVIEDSESEELSDRDGLSSPLKSTEQQSIETPPRKRSKRDLPDNIFAEESSAAESLQEDDLPIGINRS
ncbi:cohesin subunit SA-1-like [Xenia sp. Carnegie-2017]|uniref:cohesin subunit SA-1-like n=1 Tax=Xenia sp. Carnegie-2017 TaxID=2897299 RepID=UPI001F0498FB|nr:cohesin subunit SA-1-like [Xenia sp. Carnegie-2017]XP_046853054.1 cohesin subunit SA-1-like [Xenia sp. Carnegie-2017]XP_046853055.1 cohesin subunit SA-1-like [Xenia sp. Carnegie-2017]XP_046853056.1 cohesin subunit SA-1-like [Xenia sp. Carnegie-2017]